MDTYVIDNSIIVAQLFPDEINPPEIEVIFTRFLKNDVTFLAPSILVSEFGNVLLNSLKRKRLEVGQIFPLLELMQQLTINYQNIDAHATLKTATQHLLTFYDASYLYLAQKHHCPLLTLDSRLAQLSSQQ